MALTPSARLGPYKIVAAIGAGGMGEVYRATDSKLGRDVAIKVLPDAVALDPEHLARFDREARALASLNHPNIATVHGVEDGSGDDGVRVRALVMEFVEGMTLADRIAKGPMAVREAVTVARQIADALEAAHERGIVHRDLKPGNVMIRPDGTVKVLDFGLAKDLHAERAADAATVAPQTKAGLVLGTPAYMSPEQARGEPIDRRADIWAFGCVLFEMLTRKRLFAGTSTAEAVSQVLTQDIDWSALPRDVPPAVRQLVTRCLDRDPRRRLRDIGEARLILEDPGALQSAAAAVHVRRRSPPSGLLLSAIGALVIGVAVGGLLVWRLAPKPSPPAAMYTSILIPPGQSFNYPGRRFLAISPLGTHVAYTAGPGLWLRALGEPDAQLLLSGIGGDARGPFFSPDGQSVAYYASGSIWRISLTGGAPTRIVASVNPWGASWGQDGNVLYHQGTDGIWRAPATGGEGTRLIAAGNDETLLSPQLLPDGDSVLFTVLPAGVGLWDQARIVVQSIKSGKRVTIIDGGRDARYLPTGHLVYALRDKLLAAPLDLERQALSVPPVPVMEGVADATNVTGAGEFDIAAAGTLVYAPRPISDRLSLTWVDRSGHEEAIPATPRAYRHPRVSHDGRRIAVEVLEGGDTNIWIGDRQGSMSPLTLEEGDDGFPMWSQDDSRIIYTSVRNGGGVFSRPIGGSGADQLIVKGFVWHPTTWTADGRLIYEQLRGGLVEMIGSVPGESPQRVPLVNSPSYYDHLHPVMSPDGRWIAHHSTESGLSEVYVRPFPNVGDKHLVSKGGYSPTWSPDGRWLFYIEARGQTRAARVPESYLMAVPIGTRPAFSAGPPERLFSLRDYVSPSPQGREYDIAPDGRFLVLKDVTPGGSRLGEQIRVVQHWLDELRARVPVT